MSQTTNQAGSSGGKKAVSPAKTALTEELKEQLGMKRWLRLTARKTASSPKAVAKSGNPAADASGNVKYPNVNPVIEMTDMRDAQRSYEANLNIISATRRIPNGSLPA